MESDLATLRDEVKALKHELQRVRDEQEVRKVHHKYGYYLDKCLYQEVHEMWSNHPDAYVEFIGGRYRGKAGVKRLYIDRFSKQFVGGRNGPIHGFLLDHAMMQDIVDVSPDGTRAWGRFRTIMSAGVHDSIRYKHPRGHAQWWEGGVYENEYIKEDGVWKPFQYRYFAFWHSEYESGWAHTKPQYIPFESKTFPDNPLGPDELVENKMMWPDTKAVPFHYPHPVTGEFAKQDDLRAPEYGQDVSTAGKAIVLPRADMGTYQDGVH